MRAFYCAIYFVTIVSKNRLIRINVMPPIRISIVDQIYGIYQKIINGLNISVGSGTVSKNNPLPTAQTSSQTDRCIILEADFIAHSYNVAAGGAGNYSKAQIWNPANSGKKIIVYTILTWHTSGTLQYQTSLTTTKLSTALGVTVQNITAGSNKTPWAELYKQNDQTTTSTLFTSKTSHATVAQNGTSGNILAVIGVIKAGNGMNVEVLTANAAFNGVFGWAEVDDIVS